MRPRRAWSPPGRSPSWRAGAADSTGSDSATTVSTQGTPQKTVVVQAKGGNFAPGSVYRSASPGVVTILSVFPGGSLSSVLGGRGSAARDPGS